MLASGTWHSVLRRRTVLPPVSAVAIVVSIATGKFSAVAGGVGVQRAESVSVAAFENLLRIPTIVGGSLGTASLGWFDTPMPPLTSVLMIGLFGALLFLGLSDAALVAHRLRRRRLRPHRGPRLPTAVDRAQIGDTIQPRYLLPLLLVAVAIVPYRPDGSRPALSQSQVLATWAIVVVAHTAALHQTIRRYTTGTDRHGFDLDLGIEWWWPRAVADGGVGGRDRRLRRGGRRRPSWPPAPNRPPNGLRSGGALGSLARYRWASPTSTRSANGSSSSPAPLAPGSRPRTSTPTTTAASSTRAAPSLRRNVGPTSLPLSTRPMDVGADVVETNTFGSPPGTSPSTTSPSGPRS